MKKLHYLYEMRLEMSVPVTNHHYRFSCLPYKNEVQTLMRGEYRIEPAGVISEVTDGFGNQACVGEAVEPHDHFAVRSEGTVAVDLKKRRPVPLHPIFKYPSRYTMAEAALLDCYRNEVEPYIQSGGTGAALDVSMIERMMEVVGKHLRYEPGATTIHTTAAQALAGGAGVCQDYTHVLIGLCRMAGIPARYVAGMMAGEGATHAWAEVYSDGGWLGADPTNGKWVDESYIKLTHGRDYADCIIDKGRFNGFCVQRQKIYVKVEEIQ